MLRRTLRVGGIDSSVQVEFLAQLSGISYLLKIRTRETHIEYRHLKFFIALAEELHFTRAARKLNVAQPHLSQEIKRLEEELGVRLLLRTSRQVALTEAGRVFHEKAVNILKVTDEARRAAQRADKGETGRLTVGFAGSAGYDVLPRAVRQFRAAWGDVEIVLRQMPTFEQMNALREARIDVGFMRRVVQREAQLASRVISREQLVIALPSGHALARGRVVDWKDLAHQPWIVFDRTPNPGLFGDFQKACEAAGFEPVIAQEAGEIPTMINLVASGLGAALVPESVTKVRREGVVYRKLEPPPTKSPLVMAWRKDTISPSLGNFLRVMESV